MPSISNISFSARFDLTGVPTLILTDTSTNGLTSTRVAIFDITQPDLYTRLGNFATPDMAAGVTTFSVPLRLDSNGLPQCGTYNIVMTVRNTGYTDTTFTRNWVSQYVPVTLNITNNFDTFTPNLSVTDSTNYSVSNYNSGTITRAWNINSAATGTLTGSGVTKSLIYNGNYYESNYTISLTSSLLYTHQTYSWFTVNESINKTYTACIDAPPPITELISSISDLKLELDNAINTCQTYDHIKADFEFAESLFMHIVDKIRVDDMDNIFTDLNDLLSVLDNHQIPACNPTNIIIPPYDLSLYSNVKWGDITGNIANQTDVNLHTVTTNGNVTTNKITTGGYYLTGMTAGTGALYHSAGRVTLANYNANGSVYFEVNGGQYTMILNPDLSVRLLGYPTNGFLKTSSSNGTLVVDTNTYVTSNIYVSDGTLTGNRVVTSGGYGLTFGGTNNASTGIAKGVTINHNLVATANNDVLYALDVDPVFTLGSYTNVQKYGIRTKNIYINHEGVNTVNVTPSIVVADSNSTYFKVHPTGGTTELFMRGNNPLLYQWYFQIIADYNVTFNTGGYVTNYYWQFGGSNKMNLKSSGALLIGTTTESGYGQKLDVAGSGRTTGKFTVGSAISGSAFLEASSTNQGFLPPRMTEAQRLAIRGIPTSLYTLVGGSGYVDGTYNNKPLNGGLGYGLTANFVVSGGIVTSCTINTAGDGYAANDTLSVSVSDLGGTGAGFSIKVQNVSISNGLIVYQTNNSEGLYQYKSTGWEIIGTNYTASSPLNLIGNVLSISQSSASSNGYLSSTDWSTFNSKQNTITLTTTGSSGASTLVGDTLNIPTYSISGLGGVPTTRTLTINGTGYDLSSDRSWSVGTVTSIGTSGPLTGGTITSTGTIGITQSSSSTDGYLSSTDWNTFNNKFNLPSLTAGSVLFSNGTTIAEDNANLFWNDSTNRLGIGLAGTTSPKSTLHVGPWSIHSDLGTSSVRIGATLGGNNTVVNALHLDSDPSTLSYSQGLALTFGIHNTSFGEYTSRIVHYGYNALVRSSRLQIQTHSSSTGVWNTGIMIDESGRVGINTASPSFGLDVSGTTRITSTVTLSNLAGTGNRMVIASSTGVLSTQTITTGTVTSVDMSVPTGFSISGNPITSTGTLAVSFASGYSLPTNVKQSNWDDAYTWVSAFPSQTGNGGKYLTTDGSNLSWGDSIPGFESSFLLMGA